MPTVHAEVQALLADPSVQAVYSATPHDSHARPASACLRGGKPVLCEKPLTPTLVQTHALIELSATHRVFLMEALWSRFLPVYDQVAHWLRSGTIGAVRTVQSSFCFNRPFDAQHRVFNPQLAGGAMLDNGIYNLALTRCVLESSLGACPEPERIVASGTLAPTGADHRLGGTLVYPGGVIAQWVCGFDATSDNGLVVNGEHGSIRLPMRFWEGTRAVLALKDQAEVGRDAARCRRPPPCLDVGVALARSPGQGFGLDLSFPEGQDGIYRAPVQFHIRRRHVVPDLLRRPGARDHSRDLRLRQRIAQCAVRQR